MTETEYLANMRALFYEGGCKSCGAAEIPCRECSAIRARRELRAMKKTKGGKRK